MSTFGDDAVQCEATGLAEVCGRKTLKIVAKTEDNTFGDGGGRIGSYMATGSSPDNIKFENITDKFLYRSKKELLAYLDTKTGLVVRSEETTYLETSPKEKSDRLSEEKSVNFLISQWVG